MSTSQLMLYFAAEKQAAVFIGSLGVISGIFAAYLWLTASSFKAMAWPLIIIGLAQIAIGVGLFIRTDPQVAKLQEGLRVDPQATGQSEVERMTKVNRSFKVIEVIEVVVILAGVFLALFFRTRNLTLASVGMGLFLQAAFLFVFDIFAEHRALVYTRWLLDFSQK
jgi:hypothetical protein